MSDTPAPLPPADRAFRFKSGAVVRAGWLATDLPFLTRSLRYLLRTQGDALRLEFGLENGDIGVLAVVASNPGVTQNDLAASLVLKKSAVTRVVQRLERRGLLSRRRSPLDRRANLLSLTGDGQAIARALKIATATRHDVWFAGIAPEERVLFFDVLFRLVDHLAETHDGEPEGPDDDD
ncbi:MAG: winged helix-turn-helix transcriptional regulator [Rhodobacteraceae bacterium]|nr:winged helix-turn-helix transcriptional regulator [Paracoccaceae bacterium]